MKYKEATMKALYGRKWLSVVLAAVLLAALLIVAGCGGKGSQTPRIGADFTLTGATAYWSTQIKKGMDLAAAESKGEPKVEIVYEDNQGNPANSVSAFNKLANVDQVSLIMSLHTPLSKPLSPIAAQNKVPFLATVTAAKDFSKENEWTFRDFLLTDQQGPAIAKYAYETLKLRRIAALVVNDDYGRDSQKAFSQEFTKLGGTIVGSETIEQKATDARSQLTKLLNAKPEGIYFIVRDTTLGRCVAQSRELGFKGQVVGDASFDAPAVWKTAGNTGEGTVFTSAYVKWDDPKVKAFVDAYKAKYSDAPDWVTLYGYSIGRYAIDTVSKAGGDRDKVREALSKLDTESVRGRLLMNGSRDVLGPIGIYKRSGSQNKLLTNVDPRM